MADLVSLGTASSSFPQFEASLSFLGLGQVSFDRNFATSRRAWIQKRPTSVLCKYSVTTDQGTSSVSFDDSRGRKRDDADGVGFKPSPRPIFTSALKVDPLLGINSVVWNSLKVNGVSKDENINGEEQERIMVIESLGEVMKKAQKIEASKKVAVSVRKPPTPNTITDQSNGNTVNKTAFRKSKTLKSVWRKENPVATVEKEVKRLPVNKKVERPNIDVVSKIDSPPVAPLRSSQPRQIVQPLSQRVQLPSRRVQPPSQRVQPKLQTKSSTVKPVILKDMGDSTRPPATTGTSFDAMAKEHTPILIDRFASKQATIDPLIAQSMLAPPKPGKTSAPGRFKDDFRKKNGTSGGPRRRMTNDIDIPDEEASELDVSIPGAPTARKGRKWSKASRKAARRQAAREAEPVKAEILEVAEDGMSTEELACNLAISEGEILGFLYAKGIKPDGVQTLDKDIVKMVCKVYEVEVIDAAPVRVEEMAKKKEIFDKEDLEKLDNRPPVLTIMGHVDHGKTTLLDHIRKTKVSVSEAGGITQKIGAYKVQVPIDGKLLPCVFLDTPGHEAFGAMRARGARVTDIAIIVVAADDGIKPQTNEAVAHARAAGVPIVIAINKIDKDGANPDRVMQELSSIGLMPDDWGGDIPMVQISALKGENINDLLETVILVAELLELKANPHRNAKGTVIEAGLDKSKGPVATFIVQNGTLKRGDIIVCGEAFGKVRALFDDGGKRVDEAGPSIPIQVIGLNNVPFAGDEFEAVDSLDIARGKAELRAECIRNERISAKAGDGKITLSSFASAISSRKHSGLDLHQLVIILKVDLQGSIEAIRQALQMLPQDNVTLKFLLQATGEVSNSDVDLAVASKTIIFGFNVRAPGSVKSYAENKGVEIRLYRVIYELIDDVRTAMEGLLDPVEDHVPIGSLEVRAVFRSGSGHAAGCMVTEGKVVKDSGIRVLRNGETIFVGIIDSLRRIKEAVKEVSAGLECGIGIGDFGDWEVGDILEAFTTVQKNRTLEEASALMAAAFEEVRTEGS